MKLTNEEIARVFAMYWDCPMIRTSYGTPEKGNILSYTANKLDVIPKVMQYSTCYFDNDKQWHYKLLLTPLSDISDEHAIECFSLIYPTVGNIADGLRKLQVETISGRLNYELSIDLNWKMFVREYLISKGYAVPLFFGINRWANGKDAIELGLALSINNIKE
jgi:hypothetical protein